MKLILIRKITGRLPRQCVCAAAVLALALGCTSKPPTQVIDSGTPLLPDGGVAVTRAEVVAAAVDCAVEAATTFRTAASALKPALAAYAATPDATTKAAALEAFHVAFDAWQLNEAMLFGPAAPSTTPGGNDLRDQIDSWPLVSRCAVEEQLVSKSYEAGARALLVNRRGFPALEYLLFYEADDTACAASSPIVAQGTWAALSTAERASRRRAYAAAVAVDLEAWSSQLVTELEAFRPGFTTPGAMNPLFKSTQASLNLVSDAVFYIDKAVKDAKLARPLGIKDCAVAPCLDTLESQYAGRSKRNLLANVDGLERLALGCGAGHGGPGFDDLLVSVGAEASAEQLTLRTQAIRTALDAIEEADLKEAIVADAPSVRAVYDATKLLTDFLKTDFLSILDLDLPKTLEGDND